MKFFDKLEPIFYVWWFLKPLKRNICLDLNRSYIKILQNQFLHVFISTKTRPRPNQEEDLFSHEELYACFNLNNEKKPIVCQPTIFDTHRYKIIWIFVQFEIYLYLRLCQLSFLLHFRWHYQLVYSYLRSEAIKIFAFVCQCVKLKTK